MRLVAVAGWAVAAVLAVMVVGLWERHKSVSAEASEIDALFDDALTELESCNAQWLDSVREGSKRFNATSDMLDACQAELRTCYH